YMRSVSAAPRSTLFPYTTLFRSELRPHLGEHADRHRAPAQVRTGAPLGGDRPDDDELAVVEHRTGVLRDPQRLAVHDQAALDGGDRKSTRLHSSHVKISYAVFCL